MLLLVKMAIVAAIVVIAARVAERTRPAFGALIATLPFSLGPTYVLVALDHDAAFLASAALKSVASCGATVMFIAVFALAVVRMPLLLALGLAFLGWAVAALPVYLLGWTLAGAITYAALILLSSAIATRGLRGYRPGGPPLTRWWDVPARALAVALLVGFIAGLSEVLGPAGVGTLANFPVIMSSMGVIMTTRYGPRAAAAVMANSIDGMTGIVVALTIVHLAMTPLGPPLALLFGLLTSMAWNTSLFLWHRRAVR